MSTAAPNLNWTTATTEQNGDPSLAIVDIIVIFVYFAVILAIGLWATFTSSRKSVKGYFLAGKNMVWWPVGCSLFASNIGAVHFIGLSGTGAIAGIAVASFEWLAAYLILLLGWCFVPIYVSSGVYTMPEYLQKRYGGQRLRVTTAIISMFLYVTTKIAVDLYAGALFIQLTLGINLYLAIVSLLAVTAIYTILGGLRAVIYTDTMQTVIMVIGGLILMFLGFEKIGGYDKLEEKYMNAIPQSTLDKLGTENATSCGLPRSDSFHMLRHPVDSDLPWPAMISGIAIIGTLYFCSDQVIVQRVIAANSIQDAKGGCILAALLKITPMYLMVMTGMISRVLFADEVACSNPADCEEICQNPQGCSNIAYPMLVLGVLPAGLRGVMVASMLSALMSSLTSIFNSTSTIFTLDIWKRIRKSATEREQLIVGKLTVLALVVISILWIPILSSSAGGQLFVYINVVLAALGSPIVSLFIYGILWPRANEKGAFWGLVVGFTVGLTRLILELFYVAPSCGEPETRPPIIYKINYMYVSPIIFVISSVVIICVSFLTKPPHENELYGTTWSTIRKRKTTVANNSSGDLNMREMEAGVIGSPKEEDIDNELSALDGMNKDEGSSVSVSLQENQYLTELYENPKWSFVLNTAAICVMITVAFLVGLHA
ncbi:sodium/mannose cotransporter SLC5A10-like [Styela clava]